MYHRLRDVYEMIALYAGKLSNCFRHYANFIVHFLMQLK